MQLTEQPLLDVMRQPIMTVPVDMRVAAALEWAREHQVHHLPVSRGVELVGFVCTCDLYEASLQASVQDVMKTPVVLDAAGSVVDAAMKMKERGVGSVIVVRESGPCGILTRGDLLALGPDADEQLGLERCECCGLSRHLETNPRGQTLCIYCGERASEESWFELGVGD